MAEQLCILCCSRFHPEIAAAVAAEGWDDVVTASFPTDCGRPAMTREALLALVPEGCSQAIALGSVCLSGIEDNGASGLTVCRHQQCFHLLAGTTLVDEAISSGGYLMTPSWLADWRTALADTGFAQPEDFFRECGRELVLLDTGLDDAGSARLAELGKAAKLPVRRIAVGLDYLRSSLARLVTGWRLTREQQTARERNRAHASELANHLAAMDMLSQLAGMQQETDVIEGIDELFRMLFAPTALHYVRFERERAVPVAPMPENLLTAVHQLTSRHALLPDGQGFLLRIGYGGHTLGVIAVVGLAFPRYLERYLNMALAVADVCGLAIDNARNRKRLLEAEKMAALGIMVSGIAHEINTPLGVGLTAASTLGVQTRQLAEQFSGRSMTQSDLQRYFESTAAGTALLRQNLERIGQLIDAFRKVAIENLPLVATPFRIRDCVIDVLHSFGDSFPADRITVALECDPELEIASLPVDWASIFSNLIGNSLRHGFPGGRSGRIEISIVHDDNGLLVDYRDDGAGMEAESLARIFDPFFTTNLQQGMGLGMHLVYNLVTSRFGGSIVCDSQPGKGMHCHISLPPCKEPAHE